MACQREDAEQADDDDDIMTLKEFRATCKVGGFIDYDGYGCLAYEAAGRIWCTHIVIRPSTANQRWPKVYTHVVWYNR